MARPAPAVQRTVQVLKYLAEHPRDRFTLSDLARNLGMNKATVHAMLATLYEEGVLIRHPSDKTYTLGPALIGLGVAAAIDAKTALELARPEIKAIHEELDVSIVVNTYINGDNVILERRDTDRPITGYLPVGSQWRLVPPQGREYMAWASESEVMIWLDQAPGRPTARYKEKMFDVLNETRRLGYVILTPELIDLQRLMASLKQISGARTLQNQVMRLIKQVDSEAVVEAGSEPSALANAIISPVFGPDGRVILAIAITGFPPDLAPRGIARLTRRLVNGTRAITETLHGYEGTPDWATA